VIVELNTVNFARFLRYTTSVDAVCRRTACFGIYSRAVFGGRETHGQCMLPIVTCRRFLHIVYFSTGCA